MMVQVDESTDMRPKWKRFLSNITAEPTFLLFTLASELFFPIQMNFIYMRTCLDLFHNDTSICDHLKNASYVKEEDLVQKEASHWNMYVDYSCTFPSLVLILVYGVISDTYSQKLVMVIPLLTAALSVSVFILMSIFPSVPLYVVIPSAVLYGLGGSWTTFYMATLGYVTKICSEQDRTVRIAAMDGMYSVGAALAYFCGGFIFDCTGFTFVFSLVLSIFVVAIIYTWIRIRNIPLDTSEQERSASEVGKVKSIVNVFVDSVKTITKKRKMNGRCQVIKMFCMVILILLGTAPSWIVVFLYLKKKPLSWSPSLYGVFLGYRNLVEGIGTLVLLPLVKRLSSVEDVTLLAVALFKGGLGLLWFSLSTVTFMVFLSPLVGLFGANIWVLQRSVLSVYIDSDEVGKIFAIVGWLQTASTLLADTTYNNLYPLTLDSWPGMVFALGGSILILSNFIVLWIHCDAKKRVRYSQMAEDQQGRGSAGPRISRDEDQQGRGSDDQLNQLEDDHVDNDDDVPLLTNITADTEVEPGQDDSLLTS